MSVLKSYRWKIYLAGLLRGCFWFLIPKVNYNPHRIYRKTRTWQHSHLNWVLHTQENSQNCNYYMNPLLETIYYLYGGKNITIINVSELKHWIWIEVKIIKMSQFHLRFQFLRFISRFKSLLRVSGKHPVFSGMILHTAITHSSAQRIPYHKQSWEQNGIHPVVLEKTIRSRSISSTSSSQQKCNSF